MPVIQVHDKQFQPYINEEQLQTRIKELAAQLNNDLQGSRPLFIAILNGSFMFAADIFKHLDVNAEICFIKLASYKGTKSTGNVVTAIGLDEDLFGRTVVILEDIVDTGKTLSQFLPQLEHQHPKKLMIAALLHKPEALQYPIKIDYLGFSVPNKFLLGYGLDYDGLGRNLPEIYQLVE
ncbi:hypoxanthine phosphoribosyltransferase [Chitinophaga costaii]|uniref:Hypoxanthine phosphoribosyltransferase n=1 Tax=Chitinophaga costaii TaxID=1335309 RepID=A0A1C4BZA8_9BACT|nr:hypoxanthine phosphoribosyltransferase [Chitinophaga costaii]PUZ27410.1 hypoxanthine phosphoribosyltransferase [Chitinophaga costaii]SCC12150.1 hypoxanthine phosphoribosyltransferase [Chitinophaga costaii]